MTAQRETLPIVVNPEPRCPVVLLLDTSRSMRGVKIQELDQGVRHYVEAVGTDEVARFRVETCIVSFGGSVRITKDFETMVDYGEIPTLTAKGGTPMGKAISTGLDYLEERKALYRRHGLQYYRPWVFLLTDGEPTDSWEAAAQRVHQGESAQKFLFFAIGVEGADFATLRQIAPPSRPPLKLKELHFAEFFRWLSNSVLMVSCGEVGDQIETDPWDSWGAIPTSSE